MMNRDPGHIAAVSGAFYESQGRVLLVKTPGRGWECPGGQVELGEDLLEALLREVEEESACKVGVEWKGPESYWRQWVNEP